MFRLLLSLLVVMLFSVTLSAQQVPSYIPNQGLLGYWPFNGNADDESGNGYDGSVSGATLTFDRFGSANSAYYFDGGSDIINLPSPFSSGVTELSIVAWFKPEFSGAPSDQIISVWHQGFGGINNGGVCYLSYYPNPSNFRFLIRTGPDNVNQVVTNNPTQEWHCAVLTYDGSILSVYLDNVLIGTSPLDPEQYSTSAPFALGNLSSNTVQGFIGPIDDVGIWNRALSETEIANIYNACEGSIEAEITPNGSTTFCDGGFVQLTSNSADSYLWSNGATTQTITVTAAGNYTVTVFDGDGCSATSESIEVIVNEVPSSAVNVSGSTELCSGETVMLTALGTGSYLWSNAATSQSIEVDAAGSYSVTVTNNGCSATSEPIEVSVTPTPEAGIVPNGPAEFCEGGFVQLTAQGEGSYQWNTGATSQSITVSDAGSYSVIVTNNGCSDISESVTVTVNPLPTVVLSGLEDICENAQPVELSGGSPAGGDYVLNGESAVEINPTETGPGMQAVGYSYTDGNGCSNSASGSIMVHAVEPAEIIGLNSTYLPGDGPSDLMAEPVGGVFGGAVVSGNVFDPNMTGPGTHNVSYAVVDENGCISLTGACTTVEMTTGGQFGDDGLHGVRIYPNPASTYVTIEHPYENARVEVVNAVGQVVFWEQSISRIHRLSIDLFPEGVYFLRLQSKFGEYMTKSFVKK